MSCSSSSRVIPPYTPTYDECQKRKILDLASPSKFNLIYDKENPNLQELADEIFVKIFRNVHSLTRVVERSHRLGRTTVCTIKCDNKEFPLVESKISSDGQSHDIWKQGITFLNSSGDSLFSYIARSGAIDELQKLFDYNISLQTPDKKGNFPVHWCAKIQFRPPPFFLVHYGERKASNNKTPGHKSASIGHNSDFIFLSKVYYGLYQFTKEKHGRLIGTTWDLPPICVALIKGHYKLVADLLRQDGLNQTPPAVQKDPIYRKLNLFELAIEQGCFFELVNNLTPDLIAKMPYEELERIATRLKQEKVVEYLKVVQSLVNVIFTDETTLTQLMNSFVESYKKNPCLAKWVLGTRLHHLLKFAITDFGIDSPPTRQLLEVYEELGIPIPSNIESHSSTTIQNLPETNESLNQRTNFLGRSILKPLLVVGSIFTVIVVSALFFKFRVPLSNRLSFFQWRKP